MSGNDLTTSRGSPVVDFTASDYDALREQMIAYAQTQYADRWTDFNDSQWAIVFLELQAYLGDLLSYQLNSVMRETFAATATRLQNLQSIGKAFSYEVPNAEAATVDMTLTISPAFAAYPFSIVPSANVFSNESSGADAVTYYPVATTVVAAYPVGGTVTVSCREGEYFDDVLIGVSNGLANQRWQFPFQDVLRSTVSLRVGAPAWTRTKNFVLEAVGAQVFKLAQTDDGNSYAVFGDGVFGALPTLAAEIRATFSTGGGLRGNLSRNTITRVVSSHAAITACTNAASAAGGKPPPTLRQARNGIPALLSVQSRYVTEPDYAAGARAVAGVAAARGRPGYPPGQRVVDVIIAPTGGGTPSTALKASVLAAVGQSSVKKMVNNRTRVYSATYPRVLLEVLLHINASYRPADVVAVARDGLLNAAGTGMLNFASLDFEGVRVDTDGAEELLFTQTRLQNYFNDLRTVGLDRAEILSLTVSPSARARDSGNTGTGTCGSVILTSRQRRREYAVTLLSATQYSVTERILGRVSTLSDYVLVDDEKTFENEGVASFAGYRLAPFRGSPGYVVLTGATGQTLSAVATASLFALTTRGAEYYVYNPTPTVVTVGSQYTSPDGNVKFTVTAGGTPFIAGDGFTLDVYPLIGDLRLRVDEYPALADADFVTRPSGGVRA